MNDATCPHCGVSATLHRALGALALSFTEGQGERIARLLKPEQLALVAEIAELVRAEAGLRGFCEAGLFARQNVEDHDSHTH
jgi:hypothetical protein